MSKKYPVRGMHMAALLAAGIGGVMPVTATQATPGGSNGRTVIAQAQGQQSQGMQASPSQAVAGAQQGFMPVSFGRDFYRGYSDYSTAPRYNQRKARRDARRVNRAVKR